MVIIMIDSVDNGSLPLEKHASSLTSALPDVINTRRPSVCERSWMRSNGFEFVWLLLWDYSTIIIHKFIFQDCYLFIYLFIYLFSLFILFILWLSFIFYLHYYFIYEYIIFIIYIFFWLLFTTLIWLLTSFRLTVESYPVVV